VTMPEPRNPGRLRGQIKMALHFDEVGEELVETFGLAR